MTNLDSILDALADALVEKIAERLPPGGQQQTYTVAQLAEQLAADWKDVEVTAR